MQTHCVLSTADSLSYCVNRPSCVRPAALQWDSKAHITPFTHELHIELLNTRHYTDYAAVKLEINHFKFWIEESNISGWCCSCFASEMWSIQQHKANHSSLQDCRHGNSQFILQRSVSKCVRSSAAPWQSRNSSSPQWVQSKVMLCNSEEEHEAGEQIVLLLLF